MSDDPNNASSHFEKSVSSNRPSTKQARWGERLSWVLVVVFGASTAWLAVRGPLPFSQHSPQPGAVVKRASKLQPRMEEWSEGKQAAELLGYNEVYARRWSGGILTGWVEFDEGPAPRRVAIDLNELVAKNPATKPGDFSGQIIIARRAIAEPRNGQECWVWLRVEHPASGETGSKRLEYSTGVYHGPWKARGDSSGAFDTSNELSLYSLPAGQPFSKDPTSKWLEIRVGPSPKSE